MQQDQMARHAIRDSYRALRVSGRRLQLRIQHNQTSHQRLRVGRHSARQCIGRS